MQGDGPNTPVSIGQMPLYNHRVPFLGRWGRASAILLRSTATSGGTGTIAFTAHQRHIQLNGSLVLHPETHLVARGYVL